MADTRDPKFASIGLVEIGEELAEARASRDDVSPTGLVGRFFHSVIDADDDRRGWRVHWQGRVLERVSDDLYLVELFDWLMGDSSGQQLVELGDMRRWRFYDDADSMRYAYEHGSARPLPIEGTAR